jgi:hypothetical protein
MSASCRLRIVESSSGSPSESASSSCGPFVVVVDELGISEK